LDFFQLAESVLAGQELSREECRAILSVSDDETLTLVAAVWRVRRHYHGRSVQVQVLSNAKSGLCSEDCHYCSQSCVSTAEIARYPLKTREILLNEAREAKRLQARRLCMGLSGRTLTDTEVDVLCDVMRAIKTEVGISTCCSLGFITPEQARRLHEAGLDRVNHNLNTSERYYPSICTTHTFADRVRNLETCRSVGLEVCSGGIVGQGETDEDIVDLLVTLRRISPDSLRSTS
jgi:biotin synthase